MATTIKIKNLPEGFQSIRYIARKNRFEIGNVGAILTLEVKKEINGLKTIVKVDIKIEGEIDDSQREELLKQADNCYIHRLLKGEWDIVRKQRKSPMSELAV